MTELLFSGGYWALLLTIGVFLFGQFLQRKTGWSLCNPILITAMVIIVFLLITKIPNETYQAGMQTISWLLTPCTVCLGISLYTQLSRLKGHLGAILVGVAGGTAVSLGLVLGLSWVFALDKSLVVSLLPKSVTTAVAVSLSEDGGGIVALTTAAVVVTGNLGSVCGPFLCKVFRIKDTVAQGVAYGTAAHIIGTARAAQINDLTGAVSSLSLLIAGLLTAILFPLLLV